MRYYSNNRRSIFTKELSSILRFWEERMIDPKGGFYGRMDGCGKLVPDAPRGAILNARILWTFSSAYRICGNESYLKMADRAKEYIFQYFIDRKEGGVFWSVDSQGSPLDTKKQFYAIAFIIYGLSEYYRATGDTQALEEAIKLFHCIEKYSLDSVRGGYIEALTVDWMAIQDMRLSEKDRNDAKTMNTHLHILEAYTGLYRVWKSEELGKALRNIILIFLDRIIGEDGHLQLFFDMDWNSQDSTRSYGHNIEASWLLMEASSVLGESELDKRCTAVCEKLARAAMEGYTKGRGMAYEFDPLSAHRDDDRHWWVQAETLVGCHNMFQLTRDSFWASAEEDEWQYISANLICPDGEWYWSQRADGSINTDDDRAGFWKCPYHNGRMCMEIIERQK